MKINIIPHAQDRMDERDASEEEVKQTMLKGNRTPANRGRINFELSFIYNKVRNGTFYKNKTVKITAENINKTANEWKVITVLTKFY
jgi:hypothetical protein